MSRLSKDTLSMLAKQLTVDEGKKLSPYTDTVGIRTVGIGHNYQTVPWTLNQSKYIFGCDHVVPFKESDQMLIKKPLTEDQCMMLFVDDVTKHEEELQRLYPDWLKHGETRGCVLLNMCFNMGGNGLMAFKNTLKAFNEGRFADCAGLMLQSKWANQVGNRSKRLAEQMKTNSWQIGR